MSGDRNENDDFLITPLVVQTLSILDSTYHMSDSGERPLDINLEAIAPMASTGKRPSGGS